MGYILAGIFITPFHGDESDHLYIARDYAVYFVLQRPDLLRVDPPLAIDSEAHKRLLVGTVSAYTSGFVLWQGGYHDLQNWQAAWHYPDPPATNRAAGRQPPPRLLWWGRLASALFTAGCVGLLVHLGRRVGYPLGGFLAAALFALHPVILLNGRRVMQEGALLFFTLLLLDAAMRFLASSDWRRAVWLGGVAALALASKPSALLAVGAVLLGVLVVERGRLLGQLALILFTAALFYLLLTPAIWNNPPARVLLAARLRADVLAGQTAASGHAHTSVSDRLHALVAQPFAAEVQYYESPAFADDPITRAQIRHYTASPLKGFRLPPLLGWGLALVGGVGLVRAGSAGRLLLLWVVVTGVGLGVAVPLDWGRYYLPWTLGMVFAAGLGLDILWRSGQACLPFWR